MMDRRVVAALVVIGFFLLLVTEELTLRVTRIWWLVFAGACYGVWAWSRRPRERIVRERPAPQIDLNDPRIEELRRIEAMPVEAARLQAESAVNDVDRWKVIEQTEDAAPRLRELTPNQRWFFTNVGGIQASFGGARLNRDEIRAFKWPTSTVLPFGNQTGAQSQPFVQVGQDFDDNPVLAKKGEETVYVVHGTRSSADRWWCSDYPSLFHWILTVQRNVRD